MSTHRSGADNHYGLRAFAEAYLRAQAPDDERPEAHRQLLAGLEQLFGVTLSWEGVAAIPNGPALFMLLDSTAKSCLALGTPWSGYLEAGLLLRALEDSGAEGTQVLRLSDRIDDLTQQSREAHLDILTTLLRLLSGGHTDTTFTSQDLREIGVDDSV